MKSFYFLYYINSFLLFHVYHLGDFGIYLFIIDLQYIYDKLLSNIYIKDLLILPTVFQ